MKLHLDPGSSSQNTPNSCHGWNAAIQAIWRGSFSSIHVFAGVKAVGFQGVIQRIWYRLVSCFASGGEIHLASSPVWAFIPGIYCAHAAGNCISSHLGAAHVRAESYMTTINRQSAEKWQTNASSSWQANTRGKWNSQGVSFALGCNTLQFSTNCYWLRSQSLLFWHWSHDEHCTLSLGNNNTHGSARVHKPVSFNSLKPLQSEIRRL